MNNMRKRILGIFVIVISLCIPIITFQIQDYYTFHKEIPLDTTETQKILNEHPIIAYIYQNYYSLDDGEYQEYIVKEKETYSSQEQKVLNQILGNYTEEIKKLLSYQVLNNDLLEITQQYDYEVDFGTITNQTNQDGGYYILNQIFRMLTNNDKSIRFYMESHTHKITNIYIHQDQVVEYSQEDLKDISWHMIEYLELDDIDDWNYNQNGYESNKAKLRVSCQSEIKYNYQEITIETILLGAQDSYIMTFQEGL